MFTRCRHVTDKQGCQQNSNKLLYTQHDGKEKFQISIVGHITKQMTLENKSENKSVYYYDENYMQS